MDIKPKELKKEYGYRIEKHISTKPIEIMESFSFRELLEISSQLEADKGLDKFIENMAVAIFLTVLSSLSYAPLYREGKGENKFVRCVRVADKVKSYIRMDLASLEKEGGDIYIRQDDCIDETYALVTEEQRKKALKIYRK